MDENISAADANREFSRLLREVRQGTSFTVTSHGKPVARIVPVDSELERRQQSWAQLMERLKSQPALNLGKWTRDELYERDDEGRR